MRVLAATSLILLLTNAAIAQSDTDGKAASAPTEQDKDAELLQLRIEKELRESLETSQRSLEQKIGNELTKHREYLERLDDKFYNRFQVWLPILSAVLAVIAAVFYWQVGKTRKEAFEATEATAVAKATELAQRKVDSVIIPDSIVQAAKEITDETLDQIRRLKAELTAEVTIELSAARDEVVKNKREVIEQALDEAIKNQFKDELDVIGRLEDIESQLEAIENRFEVLEQAVRIAILKQSGGDGGDSPDGSLVVDFGPAARVTRKLVEFLVKRMV